MQMKAVIDTNWTQPAAGMPYVFTEAQMNVIRLNICNVKKLKYQHNNYHR